MPKSTSPVSEPQVDDTSLEQQEDVVQDQVDEQLPETVSGEAQETVAEEPQEEPWRGYFQEVGLTDVDDLDTGLGRLTQAYRQRNEQLQQLADANRQLAEELRARARGQQPAADVPAQTVSPPQADNDPFSLPTLPPNIDRFRVKKRTESGHEEWDWADDTPPSIREAGDQYAAKVIDFQTRISTPHGFKEILDAYLDRQIVPRVEQQYQTKQQEQLDIQTEQQWLSQNDWFFEKDAASGGLLKDPISEQPMISYEGRQFLKLMDDLQADGVNSFQRRLALADKMYQRQRAAEQQQPVVQRQAAAQSNDAAKKSMLGRKATPSTQNPMRQQGSVGGQDPKDQVGYGRRLIESLRTNGIELEV